MGKYILIVLSVVVLLYLHCVTSDRRAVRNRKLRQLSSGITRCNNPITNEVTKQILDKHLKKSEFVFTGKVMSEFDISPDLNNVNAVYGDHRVKGDFRGFRVKVKRVLKGGLHKVSHIHLLVGKTGEGDSDKYSHVCYSIIRVHHTAIFLAKRSTYAGNSTAAITMETTADPMPITLRNLDMVNAYVKDMTYKPRPPLMEEPCEKKYCPWGSNCVADSDDAAHCECPSDCSADTDGPVCGTDDRTYENLCLVRRKACLEQDSTRVRHSGECGTPKRRRP